MLEIQGSIVAGHGVASGQAQDARFPDGTLALQWKHFLEAGLSLEGFHRGTVNVSVAPLRPLPVRSCLTVRKVKWHESAPSEDFSFFPVRFGRRGGKAVEALIYWPHPETKPEHFQDPHVVEILGPWMEGLHEGCAVSIWADPQQIQFRS